jgi:long-chain acyl-CoA synthetase
VHDSEAKAFFVDERFGAAGAAADAAGVPAAGRFAFGDVAGFTPVPELRAGQPATRPAGRTAGATMHYTSSPRCRGSSA